GIERLSASEYNRMEGHYVITYQKFRITELAHVNSEGYLTGHGSSMARGDRPSKYEFSYGKGNSLSTVTYYDEYSRPYFMLQYSDNSVQTADIKHPLYPDDPYYLAEGFNADPSAALENSNTDWSIKTSISRYRYEYNDKGYVTKIVYLADSSNKPAADSSIYGKEFELDSLGRVVKEFYLDAKGNRRYNQENVFAKEFIYNESNDIVEYSFYDENGSLIPNDNGIILARVSYDEYHNYICAKFYDANGELCCPDKFEYAVIECEYDEAGHNTLVRYLDEKKKPIDPNKNPAKKYEYDKYGRVKCMTLVDDNEKPVFSEAYGYCSAVYECNELGMSTVISYYNDKGELACNDATGNYAQAISYYDENLNLVKKEYLDSDGKPASVRGLGYSTIVKEFDSRNRAVDYRYYMGDKPACIGDTADSKFGYHRIKFEYVDGFIAKRTVSYYDERGSLVNLKELSEEDGEITVTETYAVIEHYFKDGYVSSQKLYTADGEIYDTYYEVENADTATGEHIKRESHYNARGDIVKLRVIYYDINGIICKISSISYNDDGSAYEKLWEYSSSGLLSTYRYTDYSSDNEIVREAIYKYNNKEQYISKHEKKTADNGAYSDTSYTYRSTGETKSSVTSYYSAEGALTQMVTYDYNKDGSYTYIKEVADTDGALTTVTEANYTADDFRTFSKEYRYSEDGTKKILEFTYNEDGSYSYVSTTYDADGTATEMLEDFLNTEGLRTHCTQAFYYSDGRKKVVEYVYNDDRSCVAYSRIYNSNGEETSFNTYYYDSNGKLISDIEE
ncbi:MAG: hypothetical protein IJD22_06635, partial [Clostridia bacterium]|nr:hypothetical protein [Clostridia bacterium]